MEDGDGCILDGLLDDSQYLMQPFMPDSESLFDPSLQHEQLQPLQLSDSSQQIHQSQFPLETFSFPLDNEIQQQQTIQPQQQVQHQQHQQIQQQQQISQQEFQQQVQQIQQQQFEQQQIQRPQQVQQISQQQVQQIQQQQVQQIQQQQFQQQQIQQPQQVQQVQQQQQQVQQIQQQQFQQQQVQQVSQIQQQQVPQIHQQRFLQQIPLQQQQSTGNQSTLPLGSLQPLGPTIQIQSQQPQHAFRTSNQVQQVLQSSNSLATQPIQQQYIVNSPVVNNQISQSPQISQTAAPISVQTATTPVTASKTKATKKRNTTPKSKAPKASPKTTPATSQAQNGTPVQTIRTVSQIVPTSIANQQQIGLMQQKVFTVASNNGQPGQILAVPQFGQPYSIGGAHRQFVQLSNGQIILQQPATALQPNVQQILIRPQNIQNIQQPLLQLIQTSQGSQFIQTQSVQSQSQHLQNQTVQAIQTVQTTSVAATPQTKGKRSIAPKTSKKKSPVAPKKSTANSTPAKQSQVQVATAPTQGQQQPTQLLISTGGNVTGGNGQASQGQILLSNNMGSQPQFIIQQNPIQIRQPGQQQFVITNNAGQTTIRPMTAAQPGTNQVFIRPQILQQSQPQQYIQVQTANGPVLVPCQQPHSQSQPQIISQSQPTQQIQIGNTLYCLPSQGGQQGKPLTQNVVQIATQQNLLASPAMVSQTKIQEQPKPQPRTTTTKCGVNLADLLKETGILNENSPPNSPVEQPAQISVQPQQPPQTPTLSTGKPQLLMVNNSNGVPNVILPQGANTSGSKSIVCVVYQPNRAVTAVKQEGQLPPSPDSTTPGIDAAHDNTDGSNSLSSSSLKNCDMKDSKKSISESSSQKMNDLRQTKQLKLVQVSNHLVPQQNSSIVLVDDANITLEHINSSNLLDYRQRVQRKLTALQGKTNSDENASILYEELKSIKNTLEDDNVRILPVRIILSPAAQQALEIPQRVQIMISSNINLLPQQAANTQILQGQKSVGQCQQVIVTPQKPSQIMKTANISLQPQQQPTLPQSSVKVKQEKKVEKEEKPNPVLIAIQQQFHADEKAASNPDCSTPFQSLDDACKRLMRFHIYGYDDYNEKHGEKFDTDFENISRLLLHRKHRLYQNYTRKKLLAERNAYLKESIMMDTLFVNNEKSDLARDKEDVKSGKILNLPPIPHHWFTENKAEEIQQVHEEISQTSSKRKLPDEFDASFEAQPIQQQQQEQSQQLTNDTNVQQQPLQQQQPQQETTFSSFQSEISFEYSQQQSQIASQDMFDQQQTQDQTNSQNTQQNQQFQHSQQPQQLSLNQTVIDQSSTINDDFFGSFSDTDMDNQNPFYYSNFVGEGQDMGFDEISDLLYQETSNNEWNGNWNPSNESNEAFNDMINFDDLNLPIENGSIPSQNDLVVHDDQMNSAIKSIMNDPMLSNRHQEQFSNFSNNTAQSNNSNSGLGSSASFGMRTNHIPSSVPDHMLDEAVKSIL